MSRSDPRRMLDLFRDVDVAIYQHVKVAKRQQSVFAGRCGIVRTGNVYEKSDADGDNVIFVHLRAVFFGEGGVTALCDTRSWPMPGWILRRSSSKNAGGIPGNTMRFYFEWTDLRPAEDVSPLIIHEPHNQGIDIQSLAERGTQFPRLAGNSWGTGLAVAALQI